MSPAVRSRDGKQRLVNNVRDYAWWNLFRALWPTSAYRSYWLACTYVRHSASQRVPLTDDGGRRGGSGEHSTRPGQARPKGYGRGESWKMRYGKRRRAGTENRFADSLASGTDYKCVYT